MAVFDDVLTTEGQRFLMRMLAGEIKNIQFTKLVLGDGSTSMDIRNVTAPVHKVAEVAIDSVIISAQNDVMITAVFKNTDITKGFYMREKALFASDGTDEVLVLYANAGSLAEWIEPSTSEVYEKIIRSILLFSQNDNVNITIKDSGYANLMDFENHINNYNNPHKVTKEQVGLGNVENLTINDQTPFFEENETLEELSSGDKLSETLGKIAKAIKDFINHIKTIATDSTLGHIKIGSGLQMLNGAASVNLTALIDKIYPVGSVYISVNEISPENFIGGTWERFSKGQTLVGIDETDTTFSTPGKTGGNKTNILSTANIPSHTHNFSGSSKPTGLANTSVSIGGAGNHCHNSGSLGVGWTDIQGWANNFGIDMNNGLAVGGIVSVSASNAMRGSTTLKDTNDNIYINASHTHSLSGDTGWDGAHTHSASASTTISMNNLTISGTTGSSGNGTAVNNLQPFVTCYMWKRIA